MRSNPFPSILLSSMWPRSFYNWGKILKVPKEQPECSGIIPLDLPRSPSKVSSLSIPDGLMVFIFSHNIVSFHIPSPFTRPILLLQYLFSFAPHHPYCHFLFFWFFFSLEKPPSCFMCLIFIHPSLHFQIDASQLPGAGWRWYEQMKVGFTVLTEISNSSISALRQSKKPTAACLEAASKSKKHKYACLDIWFHGSRCIIKHQCLGK